MYAINLNTKEKHVERNGLQKTQIFLPFNLKHLTGTELKHEDRPIWSFDLLCDARLGH